MVEMKTIHEMSVGEREEILLAVVDSLEDSAREARLEGQHSFAESSQNMAITIRDSSEELATEDLDAASLLLQEAMSMISQFRLRHPYPAQSLSIH
jgi:hypothetical protein